MVQGGILSILIPWATSDWRWLGHLVLVSNCGQIWKAITRLFVFWWKTHFGVKHTCKSSYLLYFNFPHCNNCGKQIGKYYDQNSSEREQKVCCGFHIVAWNEVYRACKELGFYVFQYGGHYQESGYGNLAKEVKRVLVCGKKSFLGNGIKRDCWVLWGIILEGCLGCGGVIWKLTV